jgi:D-amino-acid dehydrogenase
VKDPKSCLIIGGGVAGLWTARALADAGVEVTILDSAKAGSGASWGNAGWICPAQAGPLPEPGIIAHGLRDLAKRDSSLHFSPVAALRLVPWISQFARYCNQAAYDRGLLALSELGFPSFKLIEQLGLDQYCDKTGVLIASKHGSEVEHFLENIAPLAALGQGEPGEILTGDAVQDLDPVVPPGHTATLVSNHWQITPGTFTQALIQNVRHAGVKILEDQAVVGFDMHGSNIQAVLTDGSRRRHVADHYVIASGAESARLARMAGRPIPVVGGKGYSIDVRPRLMPRQAILTLDSHLALSPMDGMMRIAGGMEFSNSPTRISKGRVNAMRRSSEGFVGPWTHESKPWAGLRPVAPDGMPLIGRLAPASNVSVATGYSMLGMTISPAAGKFLAGAIIAGDDGSTGPFSPQRFRRRQ